MDYYELRKAVARLVPRRNVFESVDSKAAIKEKGRKKNYHQFNLFQREWVKSERLLNEDEFKNFIEISLRASACPMPLNADVWDGLLCGYGCKYCVPSGTLIQMADGTKKVVERVREGDRVLSFNVETGSPEIATIEETMSRQAPEVLVIETEAGELRITPEHPVWTKRGWVNAGDLTEEDEVMIW